MADQVPGGLRWERRITDEDCAVVEAYDDATPNGRSGQPLVRVLTKGARVQVHVAPSVSPASPSLWFVALPEATADPPAMVLVAMPTPHRAAGDVVDADTVAGLPVTAQDQVAALRWWYETGLVHQLYVAPAWRRQGIAMVLLLAASGYRFVQGWPALHGDGRRTDDGQSFVLAVPLLAQRTRPRTDVLPPMTPAPQE